MQHRIEREELTTSTTLAICSPRHPAPRREGARWRDFCSSSRRGTGKPAEPATLSAAGPNWSPGDVIVLGRGRALRVVELRDEDADHPPVLVVEERSAQA
jgi:hypothetical protein